MLSCLYMSVLYLNQIIIKQRFTNRMQLSLEHIRASFLFSTSFVRYIMFYYKQIQMQKKGKYRRKLRSYCKQIKMQTKVIKLFH